VYIEQTGAGDGDIKIDVAGQEYTAEANHDLDGDGIDETAVVMTEDGFFAYTDEDDDGRADVVRAIDGCGAVVQQARYDEATGRWVAQQPEPWPGEPREQDGPDDSMVVETARGEHHLGPATEDTDQDGRPDTAVVNTERSTLLITDVDGDRTADQVVRISETGDVTVSQHVGGGEWTVVERGSVAGGQNAPAAPVGTDDFTWDLGEPELPRDEQRPQQRGPEIGLAGGDLHWV